MIPIRNSYWLSEHLPNAVLVTYPDAGHGSLFQFHESFTRQAAALPWIRFGFRAVLGRRRSEGASNGGLFHSSPYRAFQRVVEPARDRSNSVIIELSEQG